MKPSILTLERLTVIENAIERQGGSITTRNLDRLYAVDWWEIEQAEKAGFIFLEIRKPERGRPSRIVRKVSQSHPTKLPPRRADLESLISWRHRRFVFYYVAGEHGSGMFSFRRRAYVAYQKAFPAAKSKGGAKASASRLLRKPHIRAAIQWSYARISSEISCEDRFPGTASEIWNTLHRLGNWRAKRAPWWIQQEWRE